MLLRSRLLVAPILIAGLLGGSLPVLAATPAAAATTTARSLLAGLTVGTETNNDTYLRANFKHWIDDDGDCQDTRAEVLIAESTTTPTYTSSSHCTVATGTWLSYYDGASWTAPGDVDIDHMVPLKEAWGSGAAAWSADERAGYANDLGFAADLVAVTDNVNQSKGDRDPAEWLPPSASAQCTYAIEWVQVKYRWRLSIDSAESTELSSMLAGSCGSSTVTPARAI